MEYYEAHEKERLEMIRKGWEYPRDHHTYEHRIKRILELL
jgi:spore maturation protein CgeB